MPCALFSFKVNQPAPRNPLCALRVLCGSPLHQPPLEPQPLPVTLAGMNAETKRRRAPSSLQPGPAAWQRVWHEVIFEAETPGGKAFDVVLLLVILLSVLVVMLESVDSLAAKWGAWFTTIEWAITLLFSMEFLARIACVAKPSRYVFSFFGLVDLVSLAPSYMAFFFTGAHSLATIRTLRLLRVFRVLKLGRHVVEAQLLVNAIKQTWPKITVFLSAIFSSIVILGTVMYLIEGNQDSGFDSIPRSVYWAIVTMTTVGYGDIAPVTVTGQTVAAMTMLLGYAIIIVPFGVFSAEVLSQKGSDATTSDGKLRLNANRTCSGCEKEGHAMDARYCRHCGTEL